MIGQTSSKTGRPSLYSSELGEEIAFRLAEGQSLRKICNNTDMPSWRTVLRWVSSKKHEFCQQYARARLVQADTYADEIIDIADAATTSELATIAKVRIDARKWVASKLKPQQYGERGSPLVEDKNNEPVLLYPSMTKEMALKIIAEQRLTEAKMGEEMKLVKP